MLSPDNPLSRALILVVERNPAVQRLERFFLEQAGYQIEFVNDGKPGPEMQRTLQIVKTRGSAHDGREHQLEISKGILIKKVK